MSSDDIELQRQMMKRIDENVRRRVESELRTDALELDSRTEPIESMPGYVSGEFSGDDLASAAERFRDIGRRMSDAFRPFVAEFSEVFAKISKAIEDNPDLFTGPRGPVNPRDVRDERGIPKPSPVAPFWAPSHNRHNVNRGSNRGRTGGRNR